MERPSRDSHIIWWYNCNDLVSREVSSFRSFLARYNFFANTTDRPSIWYKAFETSGACGAESSAMRPRYFWSTSDEAIARRPKDALETRLPILMLARLFIMAAIGFQALKCRRRDTQMLLMLLHPNRGRSEDATIDLPQDYMFGQQSMLLRHFASEGFRVVRRRVKMKKSRQTGRELNE